MTRRRAAVSTSRTAAVFESRAAAVALIFFVNGAVLGNWGPRIPAIAGDLSLDAATLGLALAGMGTGGLLATPLAALAIRARGSRVTTLASATLLSVAIVLPALAGTWWSLGLALMVLGAADAVMDVAMNAQGVLVENRRGRSILNRLHAGWSAGAVTGGLIGAGAAALAVPVEVHFAVVAAVLLALTVVTARHLEPDAGRRGLDSAAPPERSGSRRGSVARRRSGPAAALALLGALVFVSSLVEDLPQSWGALYATDLGATPGPAGLTVVAFSTAMFVGRLVGDAVVDRVGRHRVLIGGAVAIALAFLAAPWVTSPTVAVVMFAVAGLGAAPIFPAVFGMAGRLPGIAAGTALSVVSLVARIGILVAPIGFGTLAGQLGYGWALWSMVAAGLAVAALATVLRARTSAHAPQG